MSLVQQISNLDDEIKELESFESNAKISNVKTFLRNEINRLSNRKKALEAEVDKAKAGQMNGSNGLGVISVSNYAWDQTNDHVKIYIEVNKSETIDSADIMLKVNSDHKGFTCIYGKYRFTMASLYSSIDESKSSVKITKSNRLIITLLKSTSENWPSITASKSTFQANDLKNNELDADPSAGLMKMMKKMYDEGDDDMKRTIAKTWYESQNKQSDMPFPNLS